MIRVVRAGWSTSVQDLGRVGYAHLGVPTAGVLDRPLAGLLNRLVGNPDGAALLETAGGLEIEALTPVLVAVSAELAPVSLRAGERLALAPHHTDLWSYLAVRGGLAVEPVLGSRSRDSLAGIGPAPIANGAILPVGPDSGAPVLVDAAALPPRRTDVRLWPAPRLDRFPAGTFERLCASAWTVTDETSRVGVRLDGPRLVRHDPSELPSEGLVSGAVQVPHDGCPVVMLADHPTTGGYPVVAMVDPADLASVAQARPSTRIAFVPAHSAV